MSSDHTTTNDETDESDLKARVQRLEQQLDEQQGGITRREAVVGSGLLGLGIIGGASGSASADLDGAAGEALAVGGSLSVDDSYHIAGDLYAGPESARPASSDTNAIWLVTDAGANYLTRRTFWDGSSWQTLGTDTTAVNTDSLSLGSDGPATSFADIGGGGGSADTTVKPADGISAIQTALDNASAGDVIQLLSGTYTGTQGLSWPATDEVTLTGPKSARIQPTIDDEPIIDVLDVDSRDCVIEGITLDGTNQTTSDASQGFQSGTNRSHGIMFDSQSTSDHDMSGWEIRHITTDTIRKTSIGVFFESGDSDIDLRIHDWTDKNREAYEAFHGHGGLSPSFAITGSDFLDEQSTPNIGATIRHAEVVTGCRFRACQNSHILPQGSDGPTAISNITCRNSGGNQALFKSWDSRERWSNIVVENCDNNALFQFNNGDKSVLDGFKAVNCAGSVIDFRASDCIAKNVEVYGSGTIDHNSGTGNKVLGVDVDSGFGGFNLGTSDTLVRDVTGVSRTAAVKTGDFTARWFDNLTPVDASASGITATLPDPTAHENQTVTLHVVDATNPTTVSPNGSETVNGSTSLSSTGPAAYQSDGTDWYQVV